MIDFSKISDVYQEVFLKLIKTSFESPKHFGQSLKTEVTQNRSLNSSLRRNLQNLVHESIRWRKRIWGDIPPSSINFSKLKESFEDISKLKEQTDFTIFSKLSVDKLSKELSYPKWLIQLWISQWGLEPAISIAMSQNEEAPIFFRTNTLKTDRESLLSFLLKEDWPVEPGLYAPWAIKLLKRVNLRGSRAIKNGWMEVQDEGSQLCVLKSDVQSGQKVLDACARSGGKSIALAALMENKGEILACDIDNRYLEKLDKRARRSGVSIINTQWVAPDDPTPIHKKDNYFDLVFIDAPCSGLGTLRRNALMKWNISEAKVLSFPKLQGNILEKYSRYLKIGGYLIYVTCSLNKLENEGVVDRFLLDRKDFEKTEEQYFLPNVEGSDGFYVAKLHRLPTH